MLQQVQSHQNCHDADDNRQTNSYLTVDLLKLPLFQALLGWLPILKRTKWTGQLLEGGFCFIPANVANGDGQHGSIQGVRLVSNPAVK